MWKVNFFIVVIAVIAISISRRMRLSQRYERHERELSPWNALDKGIDPTDRDKK